MAHGLLRSTLAENARLKVRCRAGSARWARGAGHGAGADPHRRRAQTDLKLLGEQTMALKDLLREQEGGS